jgi:hypothetical protein
MDGEEGHDWWEKMGDTYSFRTRIRRHFVVRSWTRATRACSSWIAVNRPRPLGKRWSQVGSSEGSLVVVASEEVESSVLPRGDEHSLSRGISSPVSDPPIVPPLAHYPFPN